MNYFLSGGAKNGKSSLAQRIICAQPGPRYYLATMIPHDDEDLLRIRRHIDDRAGLGFTTVECGTDVLSALGRMDPGGAVLLDSVTALLSNEMFRADGTLDADALDRRDLGAVRGDLCKARLYRLSRGRDPRGGPLPRDGLFPSGRIPGLLRRDLVAA